MIGDDGLAMVYVETPANPTNELVDIAGWPSGSGGRHGARVVVDNTFLSPVWQKPLVHGADLSLHSATKYLGGHSDLTAGAVCGGGRRHRRSAPNPIRDGDDAESVTAWLLGRSLETLRSRVDPADLECHRSGPSLLADHDKGRRGAVISACSGRDPGHEIYQRQCLRPGGDGLLCDHGGEEECFRLLDAMQVVRLATSLGGTESLASHPWTMSPPSASGSR